MMATFLAGEDAKIDLNDVPYAVKRFRITLRRPKRDVSNTEGKAGNPDITDMEPGYESNRPGLRGADVTLEEPSLDEDDNIFQAPADIAKNDYVDIKIYPVGRGADFHHFPSLCIGNITHEGIVGEEQPVTIEGASDGIFYLYGEV
jgi:hypothetical protein